jgi:hypothetical protein
MATSAWMMERPKELSNMPGAPVVLNQKTETLVTMGSYESSVLAWRDSAREEAVALARRNPEWDRVRTYIDMIEGKQWNRPLPRYRSRFADNRMAEMRIERLSVLTDIRPAIEVRCDHSQDYAAQAEIAQKIIYHEWARKDLDLALVRAVDHALLSVGYWKIDAAMPGDLFVTPCGMDSVLPIQPGMDFQSSMAVLYRAYAPLGFFKREFGKAADGIEREAAVPLWSNVNYESTRPGYLNEYTFSSMSPAMRHMHGSQLTRGVTGGKPGAFPVAEVEQYWIEDYSVNELSHAVTVKDPRYSTDQHNYHYQVRPGERLFPRKRLLILVGNKILYDGPSPYWHGLYPFAQLILNPHVWGPGGLSAYRSLVPIQRAINEIGAGVLDLVRRAVEPQIITSEGAMPDAAWDVFTGDMPGGKLKTSALAGPGSVAYMTPPQLPAYAQQFMSYATQAFERLSGTMDATSLGKKNQVPGGDTIEQMRDSMQASFRLESRYIEPFLRAAGLLAISNIFQYYTREKRMWLFGADGVTIEDFDYDPKSMVPWSMPKEDHWKMFSLAISQGSLHGASRDRDKQVAMSLFRIGGTSRRDMLRRLDWSGPAGIAQIENEIMEEHGGSLTPDATGKGAIPRITRGARTGNPY